MICKLWISWADETYTQETWFHLQVVALVQYYYDNGNDIIIRLLVFLVREMMYPCLFPLFQFQLQRYHPCGSLCRGGASIKLHCVPTLICCGLLSACVAIINEPIDKVSHVSFVPLSFVLTCTLTDTDFIFCFFHFCSWAGYSWCVVQINSWWVVSIISGRVTERVCWGGDMSEQLESRHYTKRQLRKGW